MTALHWAARGRDVECVELLLAHPEIDVNARTGKGNTALHFAKRVEVLRLLLDRGARTDILHEDGYSPLGAAVLAEDTEKIRCLTSARSFSPLLVAGHGLPPLHLAVYTETTRSLAALAESESVDVDADWEGGTALHLAASCGFVGCARILLRAGARLVEDGEGRTPLQIALELGSEELAALFVD